MNQLIGKSMSVKDAAEIMGKSQQFVRIGLQRGLLPFGTAIMLSSIWTYYICPRKFYEYVGIKQTNLYQITNYKEDN